MSLLGSLSLRYYRFKSHRALLSLGLVERRIEFEGIQFRIYTKTSGKPPIVLLHGFLDTCHTFRRILPELVDDYDVYLIDVPGFGKSRMPAVRELWRVSSMAKALCRLIRDCLHIENPILLSHSMGGLLGIHIQFYSKRVDGKYLFPKMFMLCPGAIEQPQHDIEKLRKAFYPGDVESVRSLLDNLYHQEKELPDSILRGLLQSWSGIGLKYLAENSIEMMEKVLFSTMQLRGLRVPVTLVWGDKDKISPLSWGKAMAKAIPKARLKIIKDAGHALHVERPQEVMAIFDDMKH